MSNLQVALTALNNLANTGIVFYFIYSLRMYLTARLEKFGAETVFEKAAKPQGGNDEI